jgi:hypothetical protein
MPKDVYRDTKGFDDRGNYPPRDSCLNEHIESPFTECCRMYKVLGMPALLTPQQFEQW